MHQSQWGEKKHVCILLCTGIQKKKNHNATLMEMKIINLQKAKFKVKVKQ